MAARETFEGLRERADVYEAVSSPPARQPGLYYFTIPVRPLSRPIALDHLHSMSLYNTLAGIFFILAGLVAISFPLLFAFALEQLLGWLLVVAGVYTIFTFVMVLGAPGTLSFLLLGLLHLAVGLWLVLSRRTGVLAVAIIMAGWFIAHGLVKIILACTVRSLSMWSLPLLSGLASLALAILTISLFPASPGRILGILVGADLVVTGLSLLAIAAMAELGKRIGDEAERLLGGHPRDVGSLSSV